MMVLRSMGFFCGEAGRENSATGDAPDITVPQHAPNHHEAAADSERAAERVCDCVDQLINARALPHGVLIEFFEFEGCSAHALIAANSF